MPSVPFRMADTRVNMFTDSKALVKQHREFKLQTAEQHAFVEVASFCFTGTYSPMSDRYRNFSSYLL